MFILYMEKPLESHTLRVVATEVNPDEITYKCPFYGHTCDKKFHTHGNNLTNKLANGKIGRTINNCCGGRDAVETRQIVVVIDDTTKRTKSTWKKRNRKKRKVTKKNRKINKKK